MKICEQCEMTPICAYAQNDYELPEIFEIRCRFYKEEKAMEKQELVAAELPAPAEPEPVEAVQVEPEQKELAEVEAAVQETIDVMKDNEKYPAKKKRRTITKKQKEQILELYDQMKPEEIAEQMKLPKNAVYEYIKEEMGLA